MSSRIALGLAALALGGCLAAAPALAQNYQDQGPPQSPGIGPGGDARYGVYNESPQYNGLYNEAPGMEAPGMQAAPGMMPPPGMAAPGDQGATAECAARFRSYDAASGTYLGYDGRRHPCP